MGRCRGRDKQPSIVAPMAIMAAMVRKATMAGMTAAAGMAAAGTAAAQDQVPVQSSAPPTPVAAPPASQELETVGKAPESASTRPSVAPLFEQPGVLTPRHTLIFEPSGQYAYSSSNRVALVGYTIIPAITVGLINVQEVKSNTWTLTPTLRYGLTSRWELEIRSPYVYRNDDVVALPLNTGSGTATPLVSHAIGSHIGDVEVTTRYQFNDGGADTPYYIGSLRFKSQTGRDPFEVKTLQSASGFNGTALQQELPTGSGFLALQPGLSVLLPADPAVFFGGVSYLYNFTRGNVTENTDAGPVPLRKVAGGDIVTINFGLGLALSSRTSLSLGYEQDSVAATRVNGATIPGSTRVELGTLLLGASYRRSADSTVIVTVGVGTTRDTPDVTLTLRVPGMY